MSKRLVHALIAAARAFRADWNAGLLLPATRRPCRAWENGTNYDAPAYLRRRAGHSHV